MKNLLELKWKSVKVVRTYKGGNSFGEQALLNNKPRTATVRCLTECYFGVLNRDAYEKTISKVQRDKIDVMVNFLRRLPLFNGWSKIAISKLIMYFIKKEKFCKNECVYKQGS